MAWDLTSSKHFRRFCARTTLHGFAELQRSSRTRPLWAIMIALMCLTTGFEVYTVIASFIRKPFVTSTEPLMMSSMEFPTMKLYPRYTISPDKFAQLSKVIPAIVLRSPFFCAPPMKETTPIWLLLEQERFFWTHHPSSQKELHLDRRDVASVLDTLTYNLENKWKLQQICHFLLALNSTDHIEQEVYEDLKDREAWYDGKKNFTRIFVTNVIEQRYGRAKAAELWHWQYSDVVWLSLFKELHELLVVNKQRHAPCFDRIMSSDAFATRWSQKQRASVISCVDDVANRTRYWQNIRPYITRGQFDVKRIRMELMFSVDQMLKSCWMGPETYNCSQIASVEVDDELGAHFVIQVPHAQGTKSGQFGLLFDTNGRIVRSSRLFRQLTSSDGIKIGFGTSDRQVLVPTRTLTSLELKQTNYDRRATEDFGLCRSSLNEDWVVHRKAKYSYENCRLNCLVRLVAEECGCVMEGSLAEKLNISLCAADRFNCYMDTYYFFAETFDNFTQCMSAVCRPACEEVVHDIIFSFHNFPTVENKDEMAHLFQILMYKQIKLKTDAISLALRTRNHNQVAVLLGLPEWLVWFEDVQSAAQYSYGNASDCATCVNASKLIQLYTNRQLSVNIQPATTKALTDMHQMNTEYIGRVIGATNGQEFRPYWSRHYYNLGRFPVKLNEFYDDQMTDDNVNEYESLDASLNVKHMNLVKTYKDIGLASEFGMHVQQTHFPNQQYRSTSYKCTERHAEESCRHYRKAVADEWANDHLLLLVGYQKFEITSVVTQRRSTFNELLGAIGGNFGLFLGGSIMSVMHMVACIISWLFPKPAIVKRTIRLRFGSSTSASDDESATASQPLQPMGRKRRSRGRRIGGATDGDDTLAQLKRELAAMNARLDRVEQRRSPQLSGFIDEE